LAVGAGADVASESPTCRTRNKTARGVTLGLNVCEPQGHTPDSRTTTVVLFYSTGWPRASPESLYPQCAYLASRGVVARAPEYRVGHRHNTSPVAGVLDATSARCWSRQHADTLGNRPGAAYHWIVAPTPPTITFHGTGDTLVALRVVDLGNIHGETTIEGFEVTAPCYWDVGVSGVVDTAGPASWRGNPVMSQWAAAQT
jgi:hypothetical protein